MATIIAIIIAVMVDRYAQLLPGGQVIVRSRSNSWLNAYLVKCIGFLEKIGIKQNFLIILSAILPICIALFLLKLLFGILLGGIGILLFIAISLFYFLGNREVEAETSGYVIAHETTFGVLFWFAILGPTGAFLYWFLVVSKQTPVVMDPANTSLRSALIWLHAMAAWIPARITGFIYALIGNFSPGFTCWMNCIRNPKQQSSQVLQDCGQAAVDANTADDDVRLITRAFFAWVALIIIIVLVMHKY